MLQSEEKLFQTEKREKKKEKKLAKYIGFLLSSGISNLIHYDVVNASALFLLSMFIF